jgi:hypothetical protein
MIGSSAVVFVGAEEDNTDYFHCIDSVEKKDIVAMDDLHIACSDSVEVEIVDASVWMIYLIVFVVDSRRVQFHRGD